MKLKSKSKAKTAYALLSEIRRLILAEPRRYNQNWWLTRGRPTKRAKDDAPRGIPSCGTVGCVAGWVYALKHRGDHVDEECFAAKVLGLESDRGMAHALFAGGILTAPAQTLAHAKEGAAHIARFQKTYERRLKATKV